MIMILMINDSINGKLMILMVSSNEMIMNKMIVMKKW